MAYSALSAFISGAKGNIESGKFSSAIEIIQNYEKCKNLLKNDLNLFEIRCLESEAKSVKEAIKAYENSGMKNIFSVPVPSLQKKEIEDLSWNKSSIAAAVISGIFLYFFFF